MFYFDPYESTIIRTVDDRYQVAHGGTLYIARFETLSEAGCALAELEEAATGEGIAEG